jgi:aldose 1-epimerase
MDEFGTTPDGQRVDAITIIGGGLTARVLTYGAAVQDLRLKGHDSPLVLGFETLDHYLQHSPYFGAIAGRCANRIRDGRFRLDGEGYQTDTNFLGKHVLHGGSKGVGKRVWNVAGHGPDFVTLMIQLADGEMGFPGNMSVNCTYRTLVSGRLAAEVTATTDAPTLCNFAHHSYFNLDDGGRSDILDHRMVLEASAYTPVDRELIPTGEVLPVRDTPYDFRLARPIRLERDGQLQDYDTNFCVSAARGQLRRAAWVQGARSGVEMDVWSSEPGIQFYDGARVAREVPGLGGVMYGPRAGFCLEPQVWPDAINHPHFPQCVLRPGETYDQRTEYRFRIGD